MALAGYLLGLADDELILAHRNSEWTGHAPIIEEDSAFSNIALDEMGHAQIWYRHHAELVGEDADHSPDWLVFQREAPVFPQRLPRRAAQQRLGQDHHSSVLVRCA